MIFLGLVVLIQAGTALACRQLGGLAPVLAGGVLIVILSGGLALLLAGRERRARRLTARLRRLADGDVDVELDPEDDRGELRPRWRALRTLQPRLLADAQAAERAAIDRDRLQGAEPARAIALAGSGVSRAERAGSLLAAIVPSVRQTSDRVQEITSASEEQSTDVRQINTAVAQLSQTAQQTASSAEELANTADLVGGHVDRLMEAMAFFGVARGKAGPAAGVDRQAPALANAPPKPRGQRPAPQTVEEDLARL